MPEKIRHTKGPWVSSLDGFNVWAGKLHIAATLGIHVEEPSAKEARANTKLITAAPELLEAAKILRLLITNFADDAFVERAVSKIEAAIEKAEGVRTK